MKALILSGGKGSRLRPLTYTNAKQLLPLANKPVLFYAIESAVASGVSDIGIVVGDTQEQIREAVGDGSRWGCRVTYIEQPEPLGLAHAVMVAEQFLGRDKFLMMLGDNFTQETPAPFVQAFFTEGQHDAFIFLKAVPDPEKSGVVELRDGRVVRIVEKPKDPPSNLVAVGIYLFGPAVWSALARLKPSWRGELEISETLQLMLDDQLKVGHHVLEGWWVDTGKCDDIIEANRLALSLMEHRVEGELVGSQCSGTLQIAPSARVINSTIRGPAAIGEEVLIQDSYVGPWTSIYHRSVVENSELENSVVLEGCAIRNVGRRIDSSLIGRYASLSDSHARPSAYRMVIGDHSVVQL